MNRQKHTARSGRWTSVLLVAGMISAGSVMLPTMPALAQQGAQPQRLLPPTVRETDDPPTIRMYLLTALLGGLVVGANLIPSKRGHQD